MNLLTRRRARSAPTHVSVAERLRAAGHDPLSLDRDRGGPQKAIAVAYEDPDGSVVAGVLYQLDFRSEEEHGIGTLSVALTGSDMRDVRMLKSARGNVARFADANALVVSTRSMEPGPLTWGQFLVDRGYNRLPGAQPDYAEHYQRALTHVRFDPFERAVRNDEVPMADLRAKARYLELPGPLPRTKQGLGEAIVASEQHRATRDLVDVWPAWFQNGRDLVLRADQGPTAVALAALGDALDAGELAMSVDASQLMPGIFLYDARDETAATQATRAEHADWVRDQMDALKPVSDALSKLGHRWYFLGNPKLGAGAGGATVTRYWLNGHPGGRDRSGTYARKQPHGWYTLEELRAEQFIRDAATR